MLERIIGNFKSIMYSSLINVYTFYILFLYTPYEVFNLYFFSSKFCLYLLLKMVFRIQFRDEATMPDCTIPLKISRHSNREVIIRHYYSNTTFT